MTSKSFLMAVVALAALAGAGLGGSAARADQVKRKPRPPAVAAQPSTASDLNSPATDFSEVQPVLEDPKAELLKPRKKKDLNFD